MSIQRWSEMIRLYLLCAPKIFLILQFVFVELKASSKVNVALSFNSYRMLT